MVACALFSCAEQSEVAGSGIQGASPGGRGGTLIPALGDAAESYEVVQWELVMAKPFEEDVIAGRTAFKSATSSKFRVYGLDASGAPQVNVILEMERTTFEDEELPASADGSDDEEGGESPEDAEKSIGKIIETFPTLEVHRGESNNDLLALMDEQVPLIQSLGDSLEAWENGGTKADADLAKSASPIPRFPPTRSVLRGRSSLLRDLWEPLFGRGLSVSATKPPLRCLPDLPA